MTHAAFDAIILAAGKGTRFKGSTPKVLAPILGLSALARVLQTLHQAGCQRAVTLTGHQAEVVEQEVQTLQPLWATMPVATVRQIPQRGTGDAVRIARDATNQLFAQTVLILAGDVPLLRPETLTTLLATHHAQQNAVTLLAAEIANPTGYGRVQLEAENGQIVAIIEEADATPEQKALRAVNTGVYAFDWAKISPLLDKLSSATAQGEFYLTDIIAIARQHQLKAGCAWLADPAEMTGINTRAQLAEVIEALSLRRCNELMAEGVTILSPANTLIAPEVVIGADTVVAPGCMLTGKVQIGERCQIGPHSTLTGPVKVGDNVIIQHSTVIDAEIRDGAYIGPYAHLRGGCTVGQQSRVGNFVEFKAVNFGDHAAAAHLAYLGDAEVGNKVNMGAGSITANYDPVRDQKHKTHIMSGAKVGCNSVLVAPVQVGTNACVAAGSVITKPVAANDLAIARGRQSSLPQWVSQNESPEALFRADVES
ncbi:MAG: bifunctional UDP-N-acetylglucosamine diphosphorylase/glucosamine-1-phosphate N-acetyltransferase GlmU [Vampirovibrionales bacterium]|nr:bifunctional UDP-N-acetylglucosamine diphosphorylase/glucosamine-1-phosphate N-acetyltransferase GlmU [Vampirovibrionales bacterium]